LKSDRPKEEIQLQNKDSRQFSVFKTSIFSKWMKMSRLCPVSNCNESGTNEAIEKHLLEIHGYRRCGNCHSLMHKGSISRHSKKCILTRCNERIGKENEKKSGCPITCQPCWSRLDSEAYIEELNSKGGQRWSIRSSVTRKSQYSFCEWRCFFLGIV